jgi:hypothetical protein
MTASRSWNPYPRRLALALLLALLALACAAAPAAARRGTSLDASSEAGETPSTPPPAGETAPGPEAPPAEAGAAPRRARRPRCDVALEAPHTLIAGESPTLSGQLTCSETGEAAGASVQIFARAAGTPGTSEVATALTQADGSFAVTLAPLESNSYFFARSGRSRSPREAVRVSPLVTLAGPAHGAVLPMASRHARAQAAVHFSGTVSPSDAGAIVALQRERPLGSGTWRAVAFGRVGQDGAFAFSHSFRTPGPLVLRAFVHRHGHRLPAVSEPLSYQVAQADLAGLGLTITLTPQTVAYGEPVAIAGKLAGGAGSPVTLLARTGPGGFGAIASTTAGEDGAYSFTQTPARDTEYRVAGGGRSSTTLRAEVTFSLTATPSATTVAAGEGPTISGTVTPASPGARVYLRRVSRSGVGYETLGYATVGPGSDYSIAVPPAPAGTATYRVQIPRVPGGLRAASTQPILITTSSPGA